MPRRAWGRRLAAAAGLAGVGCQSFTDPALPRGATRLTPPPVYARWWAMTEACSGLRGDMHAVAWFVATGAREISNGDRNDLAGYYSPSSHRIVLADTGTVDGATVRHEMLHALLGGRGGRHPRGQFLGRCAGVVRCPRDCIADAGPPPPPDPAAVAVGPAVLRVAGVVEPAAPGRTVEGGWFTFTIAVTNPRPTPVVVTLAPSGDAGPPASFSWSARCLLAIAPCGGGLGEAFRDERAEDLASVTRFAAGETKRFVVDFRAGPPSDDYFDLPPGAYAFTGAYNGRGRAATTSAPDTAVVAP